MSQYIYQGKGNLYLYECSKVFSNGNQINNYIEYNNKKYRAFRYKGARKIYHIEVNDLDKFGEILKHLTLQEFNRFLYNNKDKELKPDIMSFRFKTPKNVYNFLTKEKNKILIRDDENTFTNKEVNKKLIKTFRTKNSKLYSMIYYGKEIDYEDWYCLVTKEKIRDIHPFIKNERTGTYDLHHIKVLNGVSVDKSGKEPSSFINGRIDVNKFLELCKCVLLNRKAHNAIHDFRNTDIRSYKRKYLPYVLKKEKNYKKVLKYVLENTDIIGPFPTYSKLICDLMLDITPDIELNKIKV